MMRFQSSGAVFANGSDSAMPALLTRMSTGAAAAQRVLHRGAVGHVGDQRGAAQFGRGAPRGLRVAAGDGDRARPRR